MPKPTVVLMNWNKVSLIEMAALAQNIAERISNNTATFSSPAVLPGDLIKAAGRLELAYANRMNGASAKTEFVTAGRELDTLLHTEAYYINSVANGNNAIIEMAGFTATSSSRKKREIPAVPKPPKIYGNASRVRLIIKAVPGALNYCWVIFTGEGSSVAITQNHVVVSGSAIILPDGSSRETLLNTVTAGTRLIVQVLAQNSAGKSGFSTPVSFMVGS